MRQTIRRRRLKNDYAVVYTKSLTTVREYTIICGLHQFLEEFLSPSSWGKRPRQLRHLGWQWEIELNNKKKGKC